MGLIPRSGRSPGGGNGNPLQYSCLGNLMDRGAHPWWATVHGVTKSQTLYWATEGRKEEAAHIPRLMAPHHSGSFTTSPSLTPFSYLFSCLYVGSTSVQDEEIESVSRSDMSNSLRPCGLYVAHQALLSMEFSRQECWSGLPFPSPGDLPDPGIKPGSPAL